MASAAQVLKAALQKILVQASEAPLEASEYQDAMFTMNNYMLDLDANGITLGYTEVTSLSDEITIPTGALRGLIYNLAVELAGEYEGVDPTGTVIRIAQEGLRTMRKIGQRIAISSYPSTLPIGSGNSDTTFNTTHFYPDQEAEILAETTGAIGLEIDTSEAS